MLVATAGCRQIDVHEKMTNIPGQEWNRNHKVVVEIDVKDSAYYNILFLMRHSEKFGFTNLVATMLVKDTAKSVKPLASMQLSIPLVDKEGDWAGNNLSDLYYNRVKVNQPIFLKHGRYQFIIQHEMKENPLQYVFNVGAAIEKASSIP